MISEDLKIKLQDVIISEYKILLHCLEAISLFQSAGYHGFKRMFEYFSYDRQRHIIKLRKFLGDTAHCYPKISINYAGYTGNGVITILQDTHDAAKTHIESLQYDASLAIESKEHRVMGYLEYMIKDQSDEEVLKCFRLIEKIQNTNADKAYIQELDCDLHEKYKKKLQDSKYEDWK